jgi:hypothetical protein
MILYSEGLRVAVHDLSPRRLVSRHMSQPVSPNPAIPTDTFVDPADHAAESPAPSWQTETSGGLTVISGTPAIDSYANSLMDELFEDVDRILERGVKLSTEPAQSEFVSLQPVSIPHLALPPTLISRAELAERDEAELTEFVEISRSEDPAVAPLIDRLLLTAVGISALAALTSWLIFYHTPPTPTLSDAVSPADQLKAEETSRFLDYFQRSIANLDRRTEANRVALTPPNTLPTVSVPATAAQSPGVLERVYIPVYQPPQPANQGVTAAVPTSTAPTAPIAAAPVTDPSPAASPALTAALPAANTVLMGIMQLGDRSAALFELNGVAQRVYIGENIGASGWSLVSVSSQEAVVRRNGEVRSVYIGQQF